MFQKKLLCLLFVIVSGFALSSLEAATRAVQVVAKEFGGRGLGLATRLSSMSLHSVAVSGGKVVKRKIKQKTPVGRRSLQDVVGKEFCEIFHSHSQVSASRAGEKKHLEELVSVPVLNLMGTCVTDGELRFLLMICGELKELDLGNCDELREPVLRSNTLKRLTLSGRQVTDRMAENASAGCPQLKQLNLFACGEIRNPEIKSWGLEQLSLFKCKNISFDVVEKICRCCPSLRYLNVIGTQMTEKEVLELSQAYPKIEKIIFSPGDVAAPAEVDDLE